MFEIVSDMIIEFSKLLPILVALVLIFNICAGLLWGDK